jgi:hypothetical protein
MARKEYAVVEEEVSRALTAQSWRPNDRQYFLLINCVQFFLEIRE